MTQNKKSLTPDDQSQPEQLEHSIFFNPATALGLYTNLALVRHTEEEFQIDFLQQDPAGANQLATRVWTSPGHFKRLANALMVNLQKYEKRFGTIPDRTQSDVQEEDSG